MSFFNKKQSTNPSTATDPQQQQHRVSLRPVDWIGARLSPIGSFDNEPNHDDDDDNHEDALHHLALHETLQSAPFVSERTSLLMGQRQQQQNSKQSQYHVYGQSYQQQQQQQHHADIHPMWDGGKSQLGKRQRRTHERADVLCGVRISWGLLVSSLSSCLWLAMAMFDLARQMHQASWNDMSTASSSSSWHVSWMRPSETSLVALGAFVPELVQNGDYWRLVSSAFMCTSMWELLLIMVAWRLVFLAATNSRWYRWSGLYWTAVMTGQLWTLAWDNATGVVCGCASWGTVAVLCSVGIRCPERRFVLFLLAAVIMSMAYVAHPFGSIYGMVGSAFCGWGMASSEMPLQTPKAGQVRQEPSAASSLAVWASRGLTVAWTVAPVLVIAMR